MLFDRLYGDIEAILANLFLNSKRQERETGYGGALVINISYNFITSIDVLVIVLAAITSNLRVAQVRICNTEGAVLEV